MAGGKKPPPEHTKWKKGISGNPGGRPRVPEHLRKVAELTVDELKRTIALHFRMEKAEIAEVLRDPKSKALDLIIASAIVQAIKNGDMHKAEYLFLRSLGKVTEKLELQHPEPVVIQKLSGDIVSLDVHAEDADDATV